MGQIKAYISHRISDGGVDAKTSQAENLKRAIEFGELMCKEFPNIKWHVPAEYEGFVQIAYDNKILTIKQILDVDCKIIDGCNFMVVYSPDDYISRGMKVEIDHCMYTHTPVISAVDGTYEEYVARLIHAINCQLTSMLR